MYCVSQIVDIDQKDDHRGNSVKRSEVGSAICFSGPQYAIPQLCFRSAQNAITQCFQIRQCAMRNAAIADTSATHNHSQEKLKLQNKKNKIQGGHFEVRDGIAQEVPRIL